MLQTIEYLLYALVFLLPWQARLILFPGSLNGGYWEYGSISLYATDLLFIVVAVLSIVWVMKNKNSVMMKSGMGAHAVIGAAFVVYVFCSVFWSSERFVSTYAAVKLFEGIALYYFFSRLPLNRVRLLWALLAGAVVQAILAIVQFSTQEVVSFLWSGIAPQNPMTPGVAVIEAGGRRWLRAYGSFSHPNILGGYFSIVLILLLNQWRTLTNRAWRVLRIITIPRYSLFAIGYSLLLIGLFLSFSRAAWIALVVGVGIAIVQHRAWRVHAVRIGGVTMIAILVFYSVLFWPLIASRVTGIGRLELKSTSERMQYIRESIVLIRHHTFFGVGIGNYTAAVQNVIRPSDPSWSYQPVHNVFLLILTELGIVGFVLFALFVLQFIIPNSAFIILLIILLFFDHSFWTLHSGILIFWLAIALQNSKEHKVT